MENIMNDFAIAAARNPALGEEFARELERKIASRLSDWFGGKGYAVPEGECQKLIDNTTSLKSHVALFIW